MKRMAGPLSALLLLALAIPLGAQDSNVLMPAESLEVRLRTGTFDIVDQRGSRFTGDRTSRAALSFSDGQMLGVKWARSHPTGEAFNNQPRFEVAAYELQKLFLDESAYVVPPTVLRAFPLSWYRTLEEKAEPTLKTQSVVTVLQYWLFNVTDENFWDEARFKSDESYARHFANFNIMTYLIRHNDQNQGNYLISKDERNPRVFAVDNGLSFSSAVSDRGARWRNIRVNRLPRETVDRLREITKEDLTRQLETVDQFRVLPDGTLDPMEVTANIDPRRGVRNKDGIVQFGLSEREISDVWRRLENLLKDVDDGDYELF